MKHYACDLCGSDTPVAIPFTRRYTRQRPLSTCKTCGLVYLPDRRSWDELGVSFARGYYETGVYQTVAQQIKQRSFKVVRFLESLRSLAGQRLLDVGCGEGELMRCAHSRGAEVQGMDPAHGPTGQARAKGLSVFTGTFEQYVDCWDGVPFDIIVFDFVLETTESPALVLRQARRMLADDGLLVVETGNRLNYVTFPFPLSRYIRTNPMEFAPYRWSETTLEAMLNLAGFKVAARDWRFRDPQDMCFASQRCEPYPLEFVSLDSYYRVIRYFTSWHVRSYALSARDGGVEMLRKCYGMLRTKSRRSRA